MEQIPNIGFLSFMGIEKPASKIEMIHVDRLIPNHKNIYSIEDTTDLEKAIEAQGKVKENLIVVPCDGKYKIISGHRRRKSVKNLLERGADISPLLPCLVENYQSEAEEMINIILMNSATRILTEAEKIEQYKKLRQSVDEYCNSNCIEIKGRKRELYAKLLHTSPSKIGKYDAIANNLAGGYKEELKNNAINISTAYEISTLPQKEQEELHQQVHEIKGITNIKDVKEKKETIALKKVSFEKIEAAKYLKEVIEKKTEMLTCRLETEKNQCEQIVIKEKLNYCKKYLKLVERDLFDMTGNNMFKN